MKKLILVVISLFFFSSLVFANDSKGEWTGEGEWKKGKWGSRQKQSEWKNVESGLWGQWIGQGYVCRLSNGELKEITDIKTPEEYNHFLIFDNHNKYFELTLDQNMCKTMTVGTYLVDGDHVARGTEFSKITINSNGILDFVFYGVPCAMYSIYDMAKSALDEMESLETLTYNEFLLKNGYLYLADSEPDDSLSQKCPNGTAFQKLRPRQKETI